MSNTPDEPIVISFLKEDLSESGLDKVRMVYEMANPELSRLGRNYTIKWPTPVMFATMENTPVIHYEVEPG